MSRVEIYVTDVDGRCPEMRKALEDLGGIAMILSSADLHHLWRFYVSRGVRFRFR